MQPNGIREWTAPDGNGRYEIRDELFPTVRTFVIIDPQVVQVAYPGRDGAFGLTLPAGEYVLKAFFQGKQVGKPTPVNAKEKSSFELKDPFNVGVTGVIVFAVAWMWSLATGLSVIRAVRTTK